MTNPTQPELNRIASGISEGYLKMVCSLAGLAISETSRDEDGLGVDFYLNRVLRKKIKGKVIQYSDALNFRIQLKSCYSEANFKELDNSVKYNIGETYFEKIEKLNNALLVILRLPLAEEFERWLEIKQDYTKLQKCAYFKTVTYQDRTNWIEISKENLLTPTNLRKLFDKPKPSK